MKYLLIITIVFFSCSHKSKSKDNDLLKMAQEKGKYYASKVDESIFTRCDKLAFLPYLTVYGVTQNLSDFETDGKWSRDRTQNPSCYPGESKGSISFEGLLAMLHHAWTIKDKEMVSRFIKYSQKHNWIVGQGEFSNQIAIAPISYKTKDKIESELKTLFDKEYVDIDDILKGYRGHIAASYIWLNARLSKKVSAVEYETLKNLIKANEKDPFYLALLARFGGDGDQTKSLSILLDSEIFPNTYPESYTGAFGWGSCPLIMYYLMALSVIEER